MFRIEAFVDDKKLAVALRALAGIAVGTPNVQPVVNAAKKNGKVIPASEGEIEDLFAKWAKAKKLTELTPTDARELVQSIGRSQASYSHFVGQLIKKGVIKRRAVKGKPPFVVVTK